MAKVDEICQKLEKAAEPEKHAVFPKFFQAFPGGYGEGDEFLGVRVPNVRKIAKEYSKIDLDVLIPVIQHPFHEVRQCGFFILVEKYNKTKSEEDRMRVVDLFLDNVVYCNNWDLVDGTVPKLLGPYLMHREKSILYEFAKSGDLWKQRIAILSTFYFIRECQFDDTLQIAKILLHHDHDLIHKAVGWMLREIGNRHRPTEEAFLKQYYHAMPRTMLRYAIEKFEPELRQKYLKGNI